MVATAKRLDAVWYPESDDMGEHELQSFVRELLRPLIERWLAVQKRVAHAGSDQFFYWVEGDPRHCRAPDVYVVDGVSQDIPPVGTWKLWEGHRPQLIGTPTGWGTGTESLGLTEHPLRATTTSVAPARETGRQQLGAG